MKRSLKRVFSIVLALSMIAAMASGCKKSPAASTASSASSAQKANVKITYAQYGNSLDDPTGFKNDPIKAQIEKKLNVTIAYYTSSDGFADYISNSLAVGQAPDLFPSFGESEKIQKYIKDGSVYCLSDIVNKDPTRYPTLSKIFSDSTYKAYNKLYSGDENKAYAIYSVAAFAEPSYAGVPVYNTAMLQKYNGGKTPKTVDEFTTFTQACGANKVAGWWPRNDKLTNWTEIDQTIAAPQGTTIMAPSGDAWTGFLPTSTGSDTWKLMTTSDASKAVVKQLAKMYAADALDKDVGVKGDFDDAYANFGTGKIASANFGFGFATQFRDFYNSCWAKSNPSTAKPTDLTMGYALTDNSGNYGHTYTTGQWMGYHYFIPTSCKNPERVLDLVEYLASNEGQQLLFQGIEGQQYKMNGSTVVYDPQAWCNVDKAYGYTEADRCRYVWFTNLFSGTEYKVDFSKNTWYQAVTNPYDNTNDWASANDQALVKSAQDILNNYTSKVVVTLPAYYSMIALPDDATTIRKNLSEITNRYLSAMIGGQMNIDANWSKYVAEYQAAGASKLETMLNEAIVKAKANVK